MKILLKILSSPIGIALVSVHWIIVVFAFWGNVKEPEFRQTSELLYYLTILDSPALKLATLFSECVAFLTDSVEAKDLLFVHIILFTTIQWQLVGFVAELLINEFRKSNPPETDFSLKEN